VALAVIECTQKARAVLPCNEEREARDAGSDKVLRNHNFQLKSPGSYTSSG